MQYTLFVALLIGHVMKCGKLPLTIPRRIEENPTYLNYRSEGGRTLYGEDVYVGYRYYDKVGMPALFPFGYGLSYTTFSISSPEVRVETENTVSIHATVKNTGSIPGSEVLQIYVAHSSPRINRPKRELKGFKKVSLAPGEERIVEVQLNLKTATSFWDEYNEEWCSQKGKYNVFVGNSSAGQFEETQFELDKDTLWLGLG